MIVQGERHDMEKEAARIVAADITRILQSQDHVVFGIVGGTSVGNVFSFLADENVEWQKVHLFMVDERLVALDHVDSNYGLAIKHFEKFFPQENLHPFIFKPDQDDQGTAIYQEEFDKYGGKFDIVLLSSGEDGHVGALYPHHETVMSSSSGFITTSQSPKPPPNRMSASRKLIETAQVGLVLVFGEAKEQAMKRILDEDISPIDCPAKLTENMYEHYILTDLEIELS